ncbi:Rab GDP dissociation inhibitor alpha [Entophlyctis luteolus]|nr:Rab GDP dissociation inhibitor alpha [Entophlyctis luteolus]
MRDQQNDDYDVIVLGTGLTECILSGLLSIEGKKVLHVDRNDYYGGSTASLHLSQLYSKFKGIPAPESFGKDREFNVDLIPKFAMASGEFVNILYHTDVTRYLEFRQVEGSFVYRDGTISKVPSSTTEALGSPLLSIAEKARAKSFFEFVQNYDFSNPSTQQGLDLNEVTMRSVYKHFSLEAGAQDFIGHALALHFDDSYLDKPAKDTYERICLYVNSLARYGKSPYIYPVHGLGELPQGFARLSAIHGGTYMLAQPVDEVLYDSNGKFSGIRSGSETATAKLVIGDPSYFPTKVRKTGQKVLRAICLLNHPIPNTNNADSVQIVIPQNQVGRSSDIYIACISSAHSVAASGHYVAIVSTVVSDTVTDAESEVDAGVKLLGTVTEKFVHVDDLYEPIADGASDGVFVSKSYDATSHFESTTEDVKDIYKRVTGVELKVEGKVKRIEDEEEPQHHGAEDGRMEQFTFIIILLAIFAFGAALNGCVLIAVFLDHKNIVKSRVDFITTILVSVTFTWSLGRTVIEALLAYGALSPTDKGIAGFSNIAVVSTFWLNMLLAFERWNQIRGNRYSIMGYGFFYFCMGGFLCVIAGIFITATGSDGIRPMSQPERSIWIFATIASYVLSLAIMCVLYTWTYIRSSKELLNHPNLVAYFAQQRAETIDEAQLRTVRLNIERQILMKCMTLSSSLAFSYLPFFVYVITSLLAGGEFDQSTVLFYVSAIISAADVLITPCVVIYVQKEVRDAMWFWK